jgi:hypothetical protein
MKKVRAPVAAAVLPFLVPIHRWQKGQRYFTVAYDIYILTAQTSPVQ